MAVVFHKMNEKEITKIYEEHMTKDFPPMELKPLHAIIDMMEQGIYESLLVYVDEKAAEESGKNRSKEEKSPGQENGIPIGYALVLLVKDSPYGLLDYFGTFSENRNQGYGSRILSALRDYYQDRTIMIESEYPKDAPDQKMAERRVGFYRRNGAVDTGIESRIFGVHYINFALLGSESTQNANGQENENRTSSEREDKRKHMPSRENIKNILEQLYAGMLPDEEKRKKYLEFWIRE